MRVEPHTLVYVSLAFLFCLFPAPAAISEGVAEPEVPTHFNVDLRTAARLRPQLMAASVPAYGRYTIGRVVLGRLIRQIVPPANLQITWEVRIVNDDHLNAYASPDGAIYVESSLAQLAGSSPGLWAAILSHEIAHVIRRDWARRYLFQKNFESSSGFAIVLGDPGIPSTSWFSSDKASQDMGRYCRQLELEADEEGLKLMARAGYHPDFVPSLHHLLHAHESGVKPKSLAAMHPCWEERDQELSRAYVRASIEFNRRFPEWYASPGGNPPVLVFAGEPTVRKAGSAAWEIVVPLHCENLSGAVEVVFPQRTLHGQWSRDLEKTGAAEIRELTGCTSPRTTVTLRLPNDGEESRNRGNAVYVVDAWGAVLAKADLAKPLH